MKTRKDGLQVANIPLLIGLIVAVLAGAAAPAYYFLVAIGVVLNAIVLWPEPGEHAPSLYERFLKRIQRPE